MILLFSAFLKLKHKERLVKAFSRGEFIYAFMLSAFLAVGYILLLGLGLKNEPSGLALLAVLIFMAGLTLFNVWRGAKFDFKNISPYKLWAYKYLWMRIHDPKYNMSEINEEEFFRRLGEMGVYPYNKKTVAKPDPINKEKFLAELEKLRTNLSEGAVLNLMDRVERWCSPQAKL